MMTGRTPDDLRVWDLQTTFRARNPDTITLPQLFKAHGYHATAIGKIYHDPAKFRDPLSWSEPAELDDTGEVRGKYATEENLRIYQPGGKRGREKAGATEAGEVPDEAYIDGRVASRAQERLRELAAGAEPFFLAVGFRRPHLPFSAPQKYWDLYDPANLTLEPAAAERPRDAPALAFHDFPELRGYTDMPKAGPLASAQVTRLRHGYYAATSYVDAQIGRVLETLAELGLEQKTVVVLVSDHGYHLGEQGLWTKTTNYEADVRVPLLMAVPGLTTGRETAALVESVDIYPTLAELCDLSIPAEVTGISLIPNLTDAAAPGRSGAVSQFPRPWSGSERDFDSMGYSVRTAENRYVEWRRFGTGEVTARELYAYADDDVYEHANLAADPKQAALLAQMARLLPAAAPLRVGP